MYSKGDPTKGPNGYPLLEDPSGSSDLKSADARLQGGTGGGRFSGDPKIDAASRTAQSGARERRYAAQGECDVVLRTTGVLTGSIDDFGTIVLFLTPFASSREEYPSPTEPFRFIPPS